MDTDNKWIDFVEIPAKGVTKVFNIVPKENKFSVIGKISWYGAWRKYCFFPAPNCVFETQCLSDIISFINKLMFDRKVQKQQEQQNDRFS